METTIVKKSLSVDKEYLILDPPYTVYGHTSLSPQIFSLVMNVGPLKQMIENLGDDDSFRIEIFNGKPIEYSYIKNRDRCNRF